MARTIVLFEIDDEISLDQVGFRNWILVQLKRLTAHIQKPGSPLVRSRFAAAAVPSDSSNENVSDVVVSQILPALLKEELKATPGIRRLQR